MMHVLKRTMDFELFGGATPALSGLRAENFKILCALNQLHHFGPP
jgi:hypothetical protein